MKILGMVNKYNRGIAKANKELEKRPFLQKCG